MGLEYWLEMVDRKHRYGSNLLKYHKVWSQSSDTEENFFYWLDEGDGKSEDLEACSREKLESEQLEYLSRAERYEYLLEIGEDGLLRWATNGELVTTHGQDKDDDGGEGVGGKTETRNHFTDDLHNARGILQGAGHTVPAPLAKMIEMNQDKAGWIFVSTLKPLHPYHPHSPLTSSLSLGRRHLPPHLRGHQNQRHLPTLQLPQRVPRTVCRPHLHRRRLPHVPLAALRALQAYGREFLDHGQVSGGCGGGYAEGQYSGELGYVEGG